MTLINQLISIPEDVDDRRDMRNEFVTLGLESILETYDIISLVLELARFCLY
jgi:hypothetical protein